MPANDGLRSRPFPPHPAGRNRVRRIRQPPAIAMRPIRKLAFVINEQKPGAHELAADLVAITRDVGVATIETAAHPLPAGYLAGQDACCVIGGDGTLLGVVGEAATHDVPVIGVNRGTLGFLTTFSADEARSSLPALLAGGYTLASRSLLACCIGDECHATALNDILIKESSNSRIVTLGVEADGELVTNYLCDGLIISTPTGSTAYNLSAGGPLIHPGAEVFAMTPICPHTLSNRSIIFHQKVCLRVINRDPSSRLTVAADGHPLNSAPSGEPVDISLSTRRLKLVQRADYAHFAVVRTKLNWSGGAK
ncbi:MAG: NAD(+)/NADH kinase [Opitutaceae bacterium]|nr:NAD(+)/NADH kinase [Opitutaceae bacterium]